MSSVRGLPILHFLNNDRHKLLRRLQGIFIEDVYMASSNGREGFIISTNSFWVNRFRQLEVIAGELTAVKLPRFKMATPILSTLSPS